jgi:hypothetical protein
MQKWILFFNTKQSQYPSRFSKLHLEKHDEGDAKCFIALVEDTTLERAWGSVFTAYPDYKDRGHRTISDMPPRQGPNGESMEHDIQTVADYFGR